MKKLIPSLLAALLLCGCAPRVTLINQTFVMELGDDVYGNPSLYIEDAGMYNTARMSVEARSSGLQMTDNRFVTTGLDYLGVGEYDFVLINGRQEIPFVIKIKDTQAPKAANNPTVIDVTYGVEPDWQSLFDAEDLSGVYYDADENFIYNLGENAVAVKIYDRFGNSTVKNVTANVHY